MLTFYYGKYSSLFSSVEIKGLTRVVETELCEAHGVPAGSHWVCESISELAARTLSEKFDAQLIVTVTD